MRYIAREKKKEKERERERKGYLWDIYTVIKEEDKTLDYELPNSYCWLNKRQMYHSGNLQNNASGERHSSYQHYSMSQVNDQQPVIHREHEEQSQTWGQPLSSPSPALYSNNLEGGQNFTSKSRLASSSSSVLDRNYTSIPDNSNYQQQQQQSYTDQYRALGHPSFSQTNTGAYQQQANYATAASSYSKISSSSNATTNQIQSGAQHHYSVPFFHGFKFQALPGS